MMDNKIPDPETNTADRVVTPGQLVMKRFLRNRLAIVGLIVLVFMTVFAFAGPILSPYGEYELFYEVNGVEVTDLKGFDFNAPGVKFHSRAQPSVRHPMGTDADGRDVLTRLMYGGRISLRIGFIVVLIELALGVIMGGVAGYYGKWVDNVIMRLVEIFFCLPTLPIMLILSAMMLAMKVPQNEKIYFLMGLLGILGWAGIARIVRGQILSLREQEFMVAAEATGLSPARRIFKHLVPNVMPQLIVIATLELGGIILTESALSFLGIGLSYPYASWGNMVQAVTDPIILRKYSHIWVPPGLCILLTVLAFNFVGDGLRDAFDPKMKR
ncbi:MAG: ABC transporter permease [Clostridia bacterium]|nr:ABC transporter permease [Clostridia bacterium]